MRIIKLLDMVDANLVTLGRQNKNRQHVLIVDALSWGRAAKEQVVL